MYKNPRGGVPPPLAADAHVSDLKLRNLANLWLKNLLNDAIKITSTKIRHQNDVNFVHFSSHALSKILIALLRL